MQHQIKRFRWVAVAAVALLAVPVAQANPISFPQLAAQQQGETAQGLAAEALRMNAVAKTYESTPEKTLARGSYAGTEKRYPFANESTASSGPAPISENSPVELRLQPQSPVSAPSPAHGFNWGDAGIGAGLAALLTSMLALTAGGAISRKRVAHA